MLDQTQQNARLRLFSDGLYLMSQAELDAIDQAASQTSATLVSKLSDLPDRLTKPCQAALFGVPVACADLKPDRLPAFLMRINRKMVAALHNASLAAADELLILALNEVLVQVDGLYRLSVSVDTLGAYLEQQGYPRKPVPAAEPGVVGPAVGGVAAADNPVGAGITATPGGMQERIGSLSRVYQPAVQLYQQTKQITHPLLGQQSGVLYGLLGIPELATALMGLNAALTREWPDGNCAAAFKSAYQSLLNPLINEHFQRRQPELARTLEQFTRLSFEQMKREIDAALESFFDRFLV